MTDKLSIISQERTYRMYGLVPYNISPIQQAIQFGHAVVEYGLLFSDTPAYLRWAKHDKTFIILNGGTTNLNTPGSLNANEYLIEAMEIKHANFFEPDLGDQLTAVVFLVDDRVFDKENWPDYAMSQEDASRLLNSGLSPKEILENDEFLESLESWRGWKYKFSQSEKEANQIIWLRKFLRNFRLA
jgi:hypothetical protein